MQPSLASRTWPAASLILHSGYVQAAGAALIAALAITAASVLLTRKHLTWGIYLDMPVGLIPEQAPGTGTRIIRLTLTGEPGSSAGRDTADDEAWLVVLGITNPGFAPIRGEHFSTALTFEFPGREVRGIQTSPGQATRPGAGLPASRQRQVPAVQAPPGRPPGPPPACPPAGHGQSPPYTPSRAASSSAAISCSAAGTAARSWRSSREDPQTTPAG